MNDEVKKYILDRFTAVSNAIIEEEAAGRNIECLDGQRFELFRFATWYGIETELV